MGFTFSMQLSMIRRNKKPPEVGGFLFVDVRLLFFLLVNYNGILHFFPSKHEIGLITIAVTILSSLT